MKRNVFNSYIISFASQITQVTQSLIKTRKNGQIQKIVFYQKYITASTTFLY